MAQFEECQFQNETIHVDDNQYERCTFDNCMMVYSGGDNVSIVDCSLNNCRWTFDGAAARTVHFLNGLYHGMGEAGRALVEDTVRMIKKTR